MKYYFFLLLHALLVHTAGAHEVEFIYRYGVINIFRCMHNSNSKGHIQPYSFSMGSPHSSSQTLTVDSSGSMTRSSRMAPQEHAISARVHSSVLHCGIVSFLFENNNFHIWHSLHCINVPTLLMCWTLEENEMDYFFYVCVCIGSLEVQCTPPGIRSTSLYLVSLSSSCHPSPNCSEETN